MTSQGKRLTILFALLQGAFWSSNCMLYAYLVNIMASYGYSTMASGLTLTLLSLAIIFVQPTLGYISDTFLTAKKLVIFCFSIAFVITCFLPFLMGQGQWIAIASIVFLSIFDYSIYAVIDVWAVRAIADNPGMEFAVLRSGGSIFYAVTALVMGNVIINTGVTILFIGHAAFLAFGVFVALGIKEYPCPNSRKKAANGEIQQGDTMLSALKQLAANKTFVTSVAALVFYQFASRITQSYLAVVIKSFGGTSGHMGITLFIGASCEVLFMIIAGKLLVNGASLTYLYMSFIVIMTGRIACLLIPGGVFVPMLSQFVQAMAVGFYLRTLPDYISNITPKNLTATACTVAIAFSMGGGSVPGNLLGGWVIENWGLRSYAALSVLISIAAIVIFIPNVLKEMRQRKESKMQSA